MADTVTEDIIRKSKEGRNSDSELFKSSKQLPSEDSFIVANYLLNAKSCENYPNEQNKEPRNFSKIINTEIVREHSNSSKHHTANDTSFELENSELFTTANISTSTQLDIQLDSCDLKSNSKETEQLNANIITTNKENIDCVDLGELKKILSPLFGVAPGQSSDKQLEHLLRTKQPIYLPELQLPTSPKKDSRQLTYSQSANQQHQHNEGATMNGGKHFITGNNHFKFKNSANNNNQLNGLILGEERMTASVEKREHLYKILVIGELGTGKTSIIKRYVHQFFSQNYRATIGVDFALKVLHWDANTIIRLQLWDIAGQERFGNMTRVYYKEAVGAFIVFDVTRSSTFDCVSKWKEDLDSKVQLSNGNSIPCILLANKCDQEKHGIVTSADKMDEYVKQNGFTNWFETSAKENINIEEAARDLINKILLNDKLISEADVLDGDKLNLNNTSERSIHDRNSKCSC